MVEFEFQQAESMAIVFVFATIAIALVLVVLSEMSYPFRGMFVNWIIARAKKTPYVHLRDGAYTYMERYWLVPYRNKSDYTGSDGTGWVRFYKRPLAFLLQCLGIAVRVHCIRRSDEGRDFHNHPWPFITCILRGGYIEHRPVFDKSGFYLRTESPFFGPGTINIRRSNFFHRLELPARYPLTRAFNNQIPMQEQEVWTLFITGWKMRVWGFNVCVDNVIPHYEYDKGITFRGEQNVVTIKGGNGKKIAEAAKRAADVQSS
jgi:hypothetical protein